MSDHETIETTSGCKCVVCIMSSANRQQGETIKKLQEAIARVRKLCTTSDHYLAPDEVIAALDAQPDAKQAERAPRTASKRTTVVVNLP